MLPCLLSTSKHLIVHADDWRKTSRVAKSLMPSFQILDVTAVECAAKWRVKVGGPELAQLRCWCLIDRDADCWLLMLASAIWWNLPDQSTVFGISVYHCKPVYCLLIMSWRMCMYIVPLFWIWFMNHFDSVMQDEWVLWQTWVAPNSAWSSTISQFILVFELIEFFLY